MKKASGTSAATPKAPKLKKGEQYASITLRDGKLYHLILLPGETTAAHKDATAWAQKKGGELPDRIDAIVLFRNKAALGLSGYWFWTSEPDPSDSDFAYVQDFTNGTQGWFHVGSKYRARAVRRVPIQ